MVIVDIVATKCENCGTRLIVVKEALKGKKPVCCPRCIGKLSHSIKMIEEG